MPVGFQPPQVATLEDGASLAGLFSAPSLAVARSLTQPHIANQSLNLVGASGVAVSFSPAEPIAEVRLLPPGLFHMFSTCRLAHTLLLRSTFATVAL